MPLPFCLIILHSFTLRYIIKEAYRCEETVVNNILICPIKAILHELDDKSVGYIFCTSDDSLNIVPQKNVLLLRFSDFIDAKRPDAFTQYQAEQIRDFLRANPNYGDIFICCDSGESRSPAIVAAFMRSTGESDLEIWQNPEYHPNPYVYTIMCKALGIEVDSSEVNDRVKISRAAFREQVE